MSGAEARRTIKKQLELMTASARALNLDKFWMPRNRSDRAFIDAGMNFAAYAAHPCRSDRRAPRVRQDLERGIVVVAAAGSLVLNTMADKPAVIAAWEVARRVERVRSSKPDPKTEPKTAETAAPEPAPAAPAADPAKPAVLGAAA